MRLEKWKVSDGVPNGEPLPTKKVKFALARNVSKISNDTRLLSCSFEIPFCKKIPNSSDCPALTAILDAAGTVFDFFLAIHEIRVIDSTCLLLCNRRTKHWPIVYHFGFWLHSAMSGKHRRDSVSTFHIGHFVTQGDLIMLDDSEMIQRLMIQLLTEMLSSASSLCIGIIYLRIRAIGKEKIKWSVSDCQSV